MTSRPTRRRLKAPVALSAIIERQSRKLRFHSLQRMNTIRTCWRNIAGEVLARHAVPVRLVRKTLRLAVDDHAWLTEMSYLAAPLLQRLKDALPGPWVEQLKFVVGEPPPEEPAATEPPSPDLPPATEAMRKKALEAAGELQDPQLREAIFRATLARLRRLDRNERKKVDHCSDHESGGRK